MTMKKVRIKSAVPIYMAAAVWLLVGIICPMNLLKWGTLLGTAAISGAVYLLGSKLFPGKTVEVAQKADTGDAEVDSQIEEGRRILELLRQYNDRLPDPEISDSLDRMYKAGTAVFDALEKDPSKAGEVRRFMNYYLPTAEKIMNNYLTLEQSPAKGENIRSAMQSVENSLGLIADAFEKQLDSVYRDQSFDLEAEIRVMETMLKGDGVGDGGFQPSDHSAGTPMGGV